jgi:hypothetical protein
MDDALRLLTVQLLAWAAGAWRTSCPRLPLWEDAPGGAAMADSPIVLTPRGRASLAGAAAVVRA